MVRHSPPSIAGYVASGFWGGLMIGRILLADITHKLGDRRMVFIYIFIELELQLVFWFIPNVAIDAVAISLLGVVIAPFFPVGVSVLTNLLPRELHVAAIGILRFSSRHDRASDQLLAGFTAAVDQAGSAAFPFLTGAIASKAGVAADYDGIAGWDAFMLGPHSAGQEESVMCWSLIALYFIMSDPACMNLIYLNIHLNCHVRVCRKVKRATQR